VVRPLAEVSAIYFLQCFNTVGWVTGRASGPSELYHLPQRFCCGTFGGRKPEEREASKGNRVKKESKGNRGGMANLGLPGKPLIRRYIYGHSWGD